MINDKIVVIGLAIALVFFFGLIAGSKNERNFVEQHGCKLVFEQTKP